jgi:hypothetical protein
MYFHREIFKTADVIVSPMTGYIVFLRSHPISFHTVTWISTSKI